MPSLNLKKSDLADFAEVIVLANTPLSLFFGMVRTSAMERLRSLPTEDLVAYFDYVTARAKRNEYVVGLAYAVLCALAVQLRDHPVIVDPSRLEWGPSIWEFIARTNIPTGRVQIHSAEAKISPLGAPSVDTIFPVLDAFGRPLERN